MKHMDFVYIFFLILNKSLWKTDVKRFLHVNCHGVDNTYFSLKKVQKGKKTNKYSMDREHNSKHRLSEDLNLTESIFFNM